MLSKKCIQTKEIHLSFLQLEEKQRLEAKEREESGTQWEAKVRIGRARIVTSWCKNWAGKLLSKKNILVINVLCGAKKFIS